MTRQEELDTLIDDMNYTQNELEEEQYYAMQLELISDDVKKYLELLKSEEVQQYMSYHYKISKLKNKYKEYEERLNNIALLSKQEKCKHETLLAYKVEGSHDPIKDTMYSYICLDCKKKIFSQLNMPGKNIIYSKPNSDYELNENEINDIYQEYQSKTLTKKITR